MIKLSRIGKIAALCAATLCTSAQAASPEQLLAEPEYRQVSLSPDGKKIALLRTVDEQSRLVIVDATSKKNINDIHFDSSDEVMSYRWVSDNRLVLRLSTDTVNREQETNFGELYAIDADAREGKFIFGLRSMVKRGKIKRSTNSEELTRMRSTGSVLNILPDDPDHILVFAKHWINKHSLNGDRTRYGSVYKVNVHTGKTKLFAPVKREFAWTFYAHNANRLFALTQDKDRSMVLEEYHADEGEWLKLNAEGITENAEFSHFSNKHNGLVFIDTCGNDTLSACLYDTKTGKLTTLANNPQADVSSVLLNRNDEGFAVNVRGQQQGFELLDKTDSQLQDLAQFINVFAGKELSVQWPRNNNERVLITAASDVQPPVWYVFDRAANKMKFVAQANKTIKAEQQHKAYPFSFGASDKMTINGYVTVPNSKAGQKAPAVVLVHGGPFGTREYWTFDPESQLLADAGYAVVRINFRGSSGFGEKYARAGANQTGELIQQDILEGMQYLASQNVIDGNRVCIMGASFGGYSAVQSSIKYPGSYRCAIAAAGVYDFEDLMSEARSENRFERLRYFEDWFGNDDTLAAHSPIHRISELKTPLLLAHGEKDQIAPVEQAQNLRDALKKHKKDHQWLLLDNEGHGFYNLKNRLHYYQQVLAFLNKHNPL